MSSTVEDENDVEFSLEQIRDGALHVVPALITLAVSVTVPFLIATSAIVVLFGIAIAAYATFYYTYLPANSASYPVFFDLARQSRVALHLYPDQPYYVSLELLLARLPQSVGNFIVATDFVSASSNVTIASSIRPGYIPHTSPIVAAVRTLLQLPLLVTGIRQETLSVDITLFERLEISQEHVIAYIRLLTESGQSLHIEHVKLTLSAKFEGLRWMMYQHRFISFFLFTAMFLLTSIACTLFIWFALSITSSRRKAEESIVMDVKREDLAVDNDDVGDLDNDYAVKTESEDEDDSET